MDIYETMTLYNFLDLYKSYSVGTLLEGNSVNKNNYMKVLLKRGGPFAGRN